MPPNKTLLPPPYLTLEDLNGFAIANGTVTFKDTGTAVLTTVYADADGAVVSANPLTVDAAGRYTVFLSPGQVVDVEYRDPLGTLLKTVPGVTAVPAASGNVDVSGIAGAVLTVGQLVYLSDGTAGVAGQWYPTLNTLEMALRATCGIVVASASAGSAVTVRTAGRVTGLTGLVVGQYYYISNVAGGIQVTVPPPGTYVRVVGQADTTTSLVFYANPPEIAPPVVQLYSGVGVVTQFIPTARTVRVNPASALTIHGIKAGYAGQRQRFLSIGATGIVTFPNASASAAVADRLYHPVTSGLIALAGNGGESGVVEYEYYGDGWRMITHEQGGAITPVFNASDFSATGGTWTVPAGAVQVFRYYLKGSILHISLYLGGANTVVGGSPTQLLVRIPGGFTAGAAWTGATRGAQVNDAAGQQECLVGPGGAGATVFAIQKNNNVPFAAGNSPAVLLSLAIEVQ